MADETEADKTYLRIAPYPESGAFAVLARLGLVLAALGLLGAAIVPSRLLPRLFYSYHVEHFAAFFVLGALTAAALQRRRLATLMLGLTVFAVLTEVGRILPTAGRLYHTENLASDLAGAMAALGAVAIGQFRVRFGPTRLWGP